MQVTGEHRFTAKPELVWEILLDPDALKEAIPSCESMTETGPNVYDVTLRVSMAAIKGTYRGRVAVTNQQPIDSFRLEITGKGRSGSATGGARLTLSAEEHGTVVRYDAEVKAQGALARLGGRLLGGTTRLLLGQFFKSMEKQVVARTT